MSKEDRTLAPQELIKLEVETEEIRGRIQNEQRKAEAEVRKLTVETEKLQSERLLNDFSVREKQRSENFLLTSDFNYQKFWFTGMVEHGSVRTCIEVLNHWDKAYPLKPIEVVIMSPGGSVIDGMVLFDFIRSLSGRGHQITTTALGMAASQAGIILQAGDIRRMHKEAWILIHEFSGGAVGKIGEIEDMVEWVKRMQDRCLNILAERSQSSRAVEPLTKEQFKDGWRRKDWWLSSDECLKHGIVDEII